MDDQQALDIVSTLANGANPATGEVFDADSPYQIPKIIRALFAAQRALKLQLELRLESQVPARRSSETLAVPAGPARKASYTNAGKPWSSDEDKQLLAAFDADRALAEIASTHGRSLGGVRARLEKHGRLEPSAASRWPQSPSHGDAANRPDNRTEQSTRANDSSRASEQPR